MQSEVIFFPGIFAKTVSFLFGPYFEDQIKLLRSSGLDCIVAPIFQEQNQKATTDEIYQYLMYRKNEGAKDFILITHSKGGVDILDLLIQYPLIRPIINKVITIQAPYYGSPIADFLVSTPTKKKISQKVISKFYQGSTECLTDLQTKTRKSYMEYFKEEIEIILEEVDYTCISSKKERKNFKINSVLKPTISYMFHKFNIESDGLVPLESSQLSGATNIIYENLDHASAVVPKKISNFNKEEFNQKIVEICLRENKIISQARNRQLNSEALLAKEAPFPSPF